VVVVGRSSLMSCASCRRLFSSPWSLINHVQSVHGVRICADDSPPPTSTPNVEDETDLERGGGRDSGSSSPLSPGREVYSPPAAATSAFSHPAFSYPATVPLPGVFCDLAQHALVLPPPVRPFDGTSPGSLPADSCAERLRQLASCCATGSLLGGPAGTDPPTYCYVCRRQFVDAASLLRHWNEAHATLPSTSVLRLLSHDPALMPFQVSVWE